MVAISIGLVAIGVVIMKFIEGRHPEMLGDVDMKLCKYCKWCSWDGAFMSAWRVCEHPYNIDPVDGKTTIKCTINRSLSGKCGPEGRLWEALSAEKAWREYRKSGEAVESFEQFKERWERINVRQTSVGTVEPGPR